MFLRCATDFVGLAGGEWAGRFWADPWASGYQVRGGETPGRSRNALSWQLHCRFYAAVHGRRLPAPSGGANTRKHSRAARPCGIQRRVRIQRGSKGRFDRSGLRAFLWCH